VLALRWPFLGPGFGLQPDGWRVGLAARAIRETGGYVASRYGANPLHELLAALLLESLPLGLCLASALGAVGVALAVRAAARDLPAVARWAAALAAVGWPIVWVESVAGKDYLVSAGLAAWAVVAAAERRPALAGALFGVSVGFRLPMVALAPACALAHPEPFARAGRRAAAVGAAALLGTAVLALSPALATYGLGIFRSEDPAGYAPARLLWALPGALGPLGILGFGLAGLGGRVASPLSAPTRAGGILRASLGIVALQLGVFALNPGSSPASYLVPVAPFVVLAVALGGARLRTPALAAWALSGALLGLAGPGLEPPPSPLLELRLPLPGGRGLHPFFGEILQSHVLRAREQATLEAAAARGRALPRDAVLLAGPWRPKLDWVAPDLDPAYTVTATAARGRPVFALPGAAAFNRRRGHDVSARPLVEGRDTR
jgi:hypothetical protein